MNLNLPHRRLNLLTGEWVLVSPQRAQRPWLGQVEENPEGIIEKYDPDCYLCPGNERNTGKQNPQYTGTFVFDNDYAALLPPEATGLIGQIQSDLLVAQPEAGICRVICFSPRHDLGLSELEQDGVELVVRTWINQSRALSAKTFINYVQIFENKGAMMGASNPHPHSQVWATAHIPNEPSKELTRQDEYRKIHNRCLLCDYLAAEKRQKERIVAENDYFTVLVPFWAVWPFETILLSNRHQSSLVDLTDDEITGLADILRRLTKSYNYLFNTSFPYSMGFHQAPCDGVSHHGWHLHAHYYPPLLRSATVRKFMVGYEMLAMPQRDLTAESAAERLRSLDGLV